jgi:hypothetical protein
MITSKSLQMKFCNLQSAFYWKLRDNIWGFSRTAFVALPS